MRPPENIRVPPTKGFTLIELLIVLVIVGILVTIAVPNFNNMAEKAKAQQAVTYLKVIRTGEKIYYSNNASYTSCSDSARIRADLDVEVTEDSYIFSVTSGSPTTFLATACGKKGGATITLDQDGVFGGTSSFKP